MPVGTQVSGYEGEERRAKPPRMTAAQVAQDLARHENECAERYGKILQTMTALRNEMQPIVKVYEGASFGGQALKMVLGFIILLGGAVTAIYHAFKWLKGA
jgi:hypothetical protein